MMKKEKNGVKATLLSLVMAAVLMLPMSLLAQKSDGFFRSNNNDDVYNDRDASTLINGGGFTNNPMNQQDPNSPAPIGSGLLIMVAAGAGYAVIRRKKTVRKSAALLMAGVLMLGFTQCRKKDVATVVDNTANLVPMTLTTDGAKTSFDDGVISWVSDDKLNVVAGGKCIGTLTYDGNDFSGYVDLDDFSESDETTFYFYYVGNQTIGSGETSFTMSMSGQTGAQADLGDFHVSKGLQYVIINKSGMNVSATMRSYTSVAYFNVSGFNRYSETGENLYMYGNNIYEQLTISFSTNEITAEHAGYYISAGTSADKADAYYMFIPTSADGQTEVNHVVNFVNKRTSATTTFKYGIVSNGWYCNGGFDKPITVAGASYDAGTLRGVFTINSSNKEVHFSQGNLRYQASSSTWAFADKQYEAIGNNAGNNNFTDTRSTQSDWIDLFGWGTSGWNNGNTDYLPYNNWYHTTTSSTYGYGYGPRSGYNCNFALTGDYANADWGVYNTIENGGTGWRTLTGGTTSDAEWYYLLFTRTASTIGETENARFAKGNVNSIHGVIVFPDSYTYPSGVAAPTGINKPGSDAWNSNNYDLDDWSEMEASGAVFLPVTGRTENATVYVGYNPVGYYWSASNDGTGKAYGFYFGSGTLECSSYNRYYGYSVRLVKDVE